MRCESDGHGSRETDGLSRSATSRFGRPLLSMNAAEARLPSNRAVAALSEMSGQQSGTAPGAVERGEEEVVAVERGRR